MNSEINLEKVKAFAYEHLGISKDQVAFTQFRGGYSNLTFKLSGADKSFVFRRAPLGQKINKAHDMSREIKVLRALQKANYPKAPKPVYFEEDLSILGAPFMVMEFIEGLIIRNKLPEGQVILPDQFSKLSKASIDCLLELHHLELQDSGLINMGKPAGYVKRQVEGWAERYFRAKTDELPELEQAIQWIIENIPEKENIGFIHNDFKYDNLVLNPEKPEEIRAVLDWEMATVGDPLMDLGTTLAYWCEADDPEVLKLFNISHLAGNMKRSEVIKYYASKSEIDLSQIQFYYIFGIVKVAVIAQQIYKRFTLGNANDPRFAGLIHVVKASGKIALKSLNTQKI